MREVKILCVLLVLLLAASLVSSIREEQPITEDKVLVSEVARSDIKGFVYLTRTATISMAWRQIDEGEPFPWFTLERGQERYSFPGPDEEVGDLLKKVSKLEAVRSLGTPTTAELVEIELAPPARRFVLQLSHGERFFDMGGRSVDHRSFYVRPKGTDEVFLVAESVFGDLDAAPGPYMARQLLRMKLKDVAEVVIRGTGQERKFIHVNRDAHEEDDAFWASASSPDKRNDTVDNFLRKLAGLTIARYPDGDLHLPKGEPFMDLVWEGDRGRKEQLRMWRAESQRLDQPGPTYVALSSATHVPAELGGSGPATLEQDLPQVLDE